jgi:hypothetical protein
MIRTVRFRAGLALLAAATAALLTGCTAQHGAVPGSGTTARPAVETRFSCPSTAEVAALAAVAFTSRTTGAGVCTYGTADGADVSATVTVRHPAAGATRGTTLAGLRAAAEDRGAATEDAPRLAFDAFSSATARDCTVRFPAVDGVLTSVTASRAGATGSRSCDLATAVATLAGSSTTRSAAPIVSVLAGDRLLGTTTAGASWPWRIGRDTRVRIDRTAATGYLRPTSSTSLRAAAARVPATSAAIVFVSGTAEAGTPRLRILSDATAAFSAAASRAPKAKLIVVGPLSDGSASPADVDALRLDLEAAANIAGARFLDLPVGTGLDEVAGQVATTLRSEGVAAR